MVCSTDAGNLFMSTSSAKVRGKKEMQMIFHNPVSCTYAQQINTCIQHSRVSRLEKNFHAQSLPFFWKTNHGRIMLSSWLIVLRPKKAAVDVFQVPWNTSIDGFDKNRKPLFCNGRRWVFPFCNVLGERLGTEAFWTRGYWLGPDNGT